MHHRLPSVVAAAAVLLVLVGCPPPPHARRHPPRTTVKVRTPAAPRVRVYRYRYYPRARVYYCTVRHRWYHRRGGKWVVVSRPPSGVELGEPVSVEYEHDHPSAFHAGVVARHPFKPAKRVRYAYRYYPRAQVYYCTVRRKWYYRRGGRWVVVAKPPAGVTLGSHVVVNYHDEHPKAFHVKVYKLHPPKPPKPPKPPRPPRPPRP